jgi:hypothetical protein
LAGIPNAPVKLVVEKWQFEHSPVATWGAGGRATTAGEPTKLLPASWQVEQGTPATAEWFIGVPAKVVKFAVEWQLSHGIDPVGM